MAVFLSAGCVLTVTDIVDKADGLITSGEYKKALDLYAGGYERHHNAALQEKYREAGNRIRNDADRAFYKGDYARAGTIYKLLLNDKIAESDFAASLSFGPGYLQRQMKASARALTEIGLVKYREEKLEEAIGAWEEVLVFDPENKSVAKAIATAHRQLQKLTDL